MGAGEIPASVAAVVVASSVWVDESIELTLVSALVALLYPEIDGG
jgi:hypothetical protein